MGESQSDQPQDESSTATPTRSSAVEIRVRRLLRMGSFYLGGAAGSGAGAETEAETAADAARSRSNTATQLRAARASTMRRGIEVQRTSLGRRRALGSARRHRMTNTKERACTATKSVSTMASSTCVMVDTAPSVQYSRRSSASLLEPPGKAKWENSQCARFLPRCERYAGDRRRA